MPLSTVQKAFREALKASSVTKAASVHSLRHAYATLLLEAGASMRQLQMWLGHNSSGVTERYAHLTPQITQSSTKIAFGVMDGLDKFA